MPDEVLKDSVFKFVSVRPPQRPRDTTIDIRFAAFGQDSETPLHSEIAALSGQENGPAKAILLAKDFLESDEYVSHSAHAEARQQLSALVDEATRLSGGNDDAAADEHTSTLRSKLNALFRDEKFRRFEQQVWDSFYANALLPRERPRDRGALISDIRLIHTLRTLAKPKIPWTESVIEQSMSAIPLLPKTILLRNNSVVPGADKEAKSSGSGTTPTDPTKRTGQGETQPDDQKARLNKAITEIAQSDRRAILQQATAGSGVVAPPLPAPRRGVLQWMRSIFVPLPDPPPKPPTTAMPSGVLNNARGKAGSLSERKLSPSTLEELKAYEIPFDILTSREVIAALERKLANITEQAFQDRTEKRLTSMGGNLRFTSSGDSAAPIVSIEIPPFADRTLFPPGSLAYPKAPGISVLGIADLMVVEQTLLKYAMGEVAHIENILKSESKVRKHRRLDRTEQSFLVSTEQSKDTEKDLQSTERFELQRETQKTIESNAKLDAGITITASWGPVSTTAHADFATSSSTSESNRVATNYAKDVTDRSVSRIAERAHEERAKTTVEEIVETNRHEFNNIDGSDHVRGVYRWVDKIYLAQVVNYGRRLMLEFIIPQPASLYIHNETKKGLDGVTLAQPEDPDSVGARVGTVSGRFLPSDLHPWDYLFWVKQYIVQDASPPPPEQLVVATAFEQTYTPPNQLWTKANKELVVPPGYVAVSGTALVSARGVVDLLIGGQYYRFSLGTWHFILTEESQVVPVSVLADVDAYAVNIEIVCRRLDSTLEKWQLETYAAILTAFERQRANYNEQVAAAQARQGVQIVGRNPNRNREIESEEIKKGCLTFLNRPTPPATAFDQFNAILYPTPPFGFPEIAIDEAAAEGKVIQFFEQAFDWSHMTYLFYPYFWGKKADWPNIHQLEDADPLFTRFLQAGAARALVPVRLNYESAVLHYLATLAQTGTGEIWNGGDAPVLNDDLFISIADEMKAETGGDSNRINVGDPWQVKIPTSLVVVQALDDPVLPDWSQEVLPAPPVPIP